MGALSKSQDFKNRKCGISEHEKDLQSSGREIQQEW